MPTLFYRLYHKIAPPCLFLGLLLWAGCIYQFHIYPPVGTYIAILAFMGVLVTIWPPEHPWSKAVWIISFLCLLFFEVKNLYRDRAAHDREQQEIRHQDRQSFQAIAKGIEEAITRSDAHFRSTISQTQNILETTTGGSSLCYMRFSFRGTRATASVLHLGTFPLSDVVVRLLDNDDLPGAYNLPPIEIGTLPVMGSRMITSFGTRWEMPSGKKEKRFLAAFTARNGAWDQMILLKSDDKSVWHFATRIERNRGQSKFKTLAQRDEILHQVIDPGFPGKVTESDWRSFNGKSIWCSDCQ